MRTRDRREYPNPGYPPSRWPADTAIGVRWANGNVSRWEHRVAQLRWTHTGEDFDVGMFWKV